MTDKDYCERCDLYTMQLQENESDDTGDLWYCPICETWEKYTRANVEREAE